MKWNKKFTRDFLEWFGRLHFCCYKWLIEWLGDPSVIRAVAFRNWLLVSTKLIVLYRVKIMVFFNLTLYRLVPSSLYPEDGGSSFWIIDTHYQTTQHPIQKDDTLNTHCCKNLKAHILYLGILSLIFCICGI
jgi:hypothetical protein